MTDFSKIGHMSPINSSYISDIYFYYIPHFCVLEARVSQLVVFDASIRNPILLLSMRPKLQKDLVAILRRFRLPSIVFTADIKQIYRQIIIDPTYRPYQRILCRFSEKDPLQDYESNTVTYCVSSSSFFGIRVLQLAYDYHILYFSQRLISMILLETLITYLILAFFILS